MKRFSSAIRARSLPSPRSFRDLRPVTKEPTARLTTAAGRKGREKGHEENNGARKARDKFLQREQAREKHGGGKKLSREKVVCEPRAEALAFSRHYQGPRPSLSPPTTEGRGPRFLPPLPRAEKATSFRKKRLSSSKKAKLSRER